MIARWNLSTSSVVHSSRPDPSTLHAMMHVREGARMVVEEQEGTAGPPDALAGELELRLAMLGDTSTLATTATVDGELGFKGRFTLSIPLPGTTKLDVPATLHG